MFEAILQYDFMARWRLFSATMNKNLNVAQTIGDMWLAYSNNCRYFACQNHDMITRHAALERSAKSDHEVRDYFAKQLSSQ